MKQHLSPKKNQMNSDFKHLSQSICNASLYQGVPSITTLSSQTADSFKIFPRGSKKKYQGTDAKFKYFVCPLYIFSIAVFYYLTKTCKKKTYSAVQFLEPRIPKQGTVLHGGDGNLKTHSNLLLGNTSK